MERIPREWFVQRFHYRLVMGLHESGNWLVTEENGRSLAPDVALRLRCLGGECCSARHQPGNGMFSGECWQFPAASFTEEELRLALTGAVREAEVEREALAELFETGKCPACEIQVWPSTSSPSRWVVTALAATRGILIPLRLPGDEQDDAVIPSFKRKEDADAYADALRRRYCPQGTGTLWESASCD
jgi:hypothetical protein